jgi:hypothetical protein
MNQDAALELSRWHRLLYWLLRIRNNWIPQLISLGHLPGDLDDQRWTLRRLTQGGLCLHHQHCNSRILSSHKVWQPGLALLQRVRRLPSRDTSSAEAPDWKLPQPTYGLEHIHHVWCKGREVSQGICFVTAAVSSRQPPEITQAPVKSSLELAALFLAATAPVYRLLRRQASLDPAMPPACVTMAMTTHILLTSATTTLDLAAGGHARAYIPYCGHPDSSPGCHGFPTKCYLYNGSIQITHLPVGPEPAMLPSATTTVTTTTASAQ